MVLDPDSDHTIVDFHRRVGTCCDRSSHQVPYGDLGCHSVYTNSNVILHGGACNFINFPYYNRIRNRAIPLYPSSETEEHSQNFGQVLVANDSCASIVIMQTVVLSTFRT